MVDKTKQIEVLFKIISTLVIQLLRYTTCKWGKSKNCQFLELSTVYVVELYKSTNFIDLLYSLRKIYDSGF